MSKRVAAPQPTQAPRDVLPMSTGVPVKATAKVTRRPTVKETATDEVVNDIKVGNRSA